MPEISRFYGIKIAMFYKEHNPPHIHVFYSGFEGSIDIKRKTLTEGYLPKQAMKLTTKWIAKNKDKLLEMWERQEVSKLPPLE